MGVADRGSLGRRAERLALAYLLGQGLTFVASNVRSRFGEIDLVMRDGECLVFAEVRYRSAGQYASAAASVDRHKRRKLERAASLYISRQRRFANCPVRFDVVAFDAIDESQRSMCWIRDAFRPGD